jgi:hypothetical protein
MEEEAILILVFGLPVPPYRGFKTTKLLHSLYCEVHLPGNNVVLIFG